MTISDLVAKAVEANADLVAVSPIPDTSLAFFEIPSFRIAYSRSSQVVYEDVLEADESLALLNEMEDAASGAIALIDGTPVSVSCMRTHFIGSIKIGPSLFNEDFDWWPAFDAIRENGGDEEEVTRLSVLLREKINAGDIPVSFDAESWIKANRKV